MRSKGQLFSLDLIIAVALVILALGLLYRQAELFQYFQKDDTMQAELYRIGLNASNQLVSNPSIVCKLGDSTSPIDYLPNCLLKSTSVTKASLGIPGNYDCSASVNPSSAGTVTVTDCSGNSGSAKNVFAVERQAVFLDSGSSIPKKDFDSCVNGNCSGKLLKATINLQVWKT